MHISVLMNECIENLNINKDSIIIDCTLGYGGHSSEILKRIPKGHLYAFDQDMDAINYSKERLDKINTNYTIIKSNFLYLKEELEKRKITKADGILYDLGVSSPQLDVSSRGFSFHHDAPLDMRMDKASDFSAYNVVNEYFLDSLIRILRDYGEEKYAVSIAKGIIKNRPIKTTMELVDVIKSSVPEKYSREKHPARKTFQAIRIEVNNELEVFEKSLKKAIEMLNIGGRICVITFHSLEDKICKDIFKSVSSIPDNLKNMPIIPKEFEPKYKMLKTIKPSLKEINDNNRARSAKLRILERIG